MHFPTLDLYLKLEPMGLMLSATNREGRVRNITDLLTGQPNTHTHSVFILYVTRKSVQRVRKLSDLKSSVNLGFYNHIRLT